MASLSDDAKFLLDNLPMSGRITNQTAMNLTVWDFERLRRAKFELRDAGLVEIIASFGGPFGRTAATPILESPDIVLAANENELYEPFKNWILKEFRPTDHIQGRDLFEVIVSGNMRPKEAQRWEIPDLIAVSLKKYRFIPQLVFKTTSFEVKTKGSAFDPLGIFEAISHSKFGNETYYCFEWPKDTDFIDNEKYQRVQQEAKMHGIGLIQVWVTDIEKKFVSGKVILEASQTEYDPSMLSAFIGRYFPDEIKNRLMQLTQSW
ncbi:MAG: hypothetical protein C4522_12130 [Desulfobacteraceae bacterium]|nr:MAG: hypothetical protein C4522_12130 [Desulfobacteraceae bacterium]